MFLISTTIKYTLIRWNYVVLPIKLKTVYIVTHMDGNSVDIIRNLDGGNKMATHSAFSNRIWLCVGSVLYAEYVC